MNKLILCLVCGEEPNSEEKCSNCSSEISSQLELLKYGSEAYQLGYVYRTVYEKQLERNGEINIKYSLIDPTSIWELYAAMALAGIVGNISYDIFKKLGRKLIAIFKREKLESDEIENFIKIVSDDAELKKVFDYISSYYHMMPDANKQVRDAVLEEKTVDLITSQLKTDELEELFKNIGNDSSNAPEILGAAIRKAFKQGRENKEEPQKPSELILKEILKEYKE